MQITDEKKRVFNVILAEVLGAAHKDKFELMEHFWEMVVDENTRQNLTRLLEPSDFIFEHILDSRELLKVPRLQFPAMDLGSGGGFPGIPCAILQDDKPWILLESEGRKAEFLERVREELCLTNVTVVAGRAEEYLETHKVGSVVTRAVGPVDKIYKWLRKCSTWNNLIFMKGPKWQAEWEKFKSSPKGFEVGVVDIHKYISGPESIQRLIATVERVPRGTSG